jgi:outer membrane protein assembly factor BamB
MVFKNGYAGTYTFNATNGDIIWHFTTGDSGMETPYGTWPTYDNIMGADGVVFFTTTEHTPTTPYYRGQHLFAVDAYTGQEIWRIKSTIAPAAIAEGVLLASDLYDGYLYAFSKGPTTTTVSASSEVIANGDSVLLKGTVPDMSPAQNGTAAVSDDSMSSWMEYLYMQQPFPATATGVSVSLDALDPNNNYVHIGDATSDTTSKYSFLWTPEIEGKYTIVASFYSQPELTTDQPRKLQ